MLKRTISLFLSLVMAFSVFSVTALTVNAVEINEEKTEIRAGEISEEDQCGKSVYYTLYTDGTLVISGAGDMYNYVFFSPFNHSTNNIKKVEIQSGITSIGYFTFSDCTKLTSITIPDSLTSIGDYAIKGCTSLSSITIPSSVTNIGEGVFYNCTSLTDVYYTGTEEQWSQISFGPYNDCLLNATIHYNSSTETPEHLMGDVNGDNVVSVSDATMIQKQIVGMVTLTESQKKNADVNSDGVLSVLDAVEIQKYLVGMSSSFDKI